MGSWLAADPQSPAEGPGWCTCQEHPDLSVLAAEELPTVVFISPVIFEMHPASTVA